MESTIQGLLDFARPPDCTESPRPAHHGAARDESGRRTSRNNKSRHYETMPDVPVVVNGDPEQLHQIFVNLLLNGIEAMPRGGIAGRCEWRSIMRVTFAGSPCPTPATASRSDPRRGFSSRLSPARNTERAWDWRSATVSPRNTAARFLAANRAEGGAVFTLELPLSMENDTHAETTGD